MTLFEANSLICSPMMLGGTFWLFTIGARLIVNFMILAFVGRIPSLLISSFIVDCSVSSLPKVSNKLTLPTKTPVESSWLRRIAQSLDKYSRRRSLYRLTGCSSCEVYG